MDHIIQKDLFREILTYQKENIERAVNFQHDLNEEQRLENSREMAAFYHDIIQDLIEKYYQEGSFPLFGNIMLSTINRCNGNCSFCGAASSRDTRIPYIMSEELLDKILDECRRLDYCGRITMEGLNEPFLDVRMKHIIPHIKKTVPKAGIHIITNGIMLDPEVLWHIYPHIEKIHINCYEEKYLDKIKKCISYVKEKNNGAIEKIKFTLRKQTEILAQFGQNECGRSRVESLACSCILPFNTLSVLPDGKINLCISDIKGSYLLGDVHTESLRDIWYGKKADDYRKKIVGGRKELDLCKNCDMFCF